MGYLGRRIGLSQDNGDSNPGGAGGAVGGGLLDLFAHGYFERQGDLYNAPGVELGLTATGGVISDYTSGSDVYRAHIFTSSGTFDVTAPGSFGDTVEYLVVAGGGGGGQQSGGGGGAGGLRTNVSGVQTDDSTPLTGATFPVTAGPTSYTVTIGGGGNGSPANPTNPAGPGGGSRGTSSVFGSITSTGGGGGANNNTYDPNYPSIQITGGSGGGGGCTASANARSGGAGNTPSVSPIQGHKGGSGGHDGGPARNDYGGGGGGAGRAGHNAGTSDTGGGPGAVPATGADGGAGVQVAISGPSTGSPVGTPGPSGNGWFAGGGGGGNHPSGTAASGGVGGGGVGGVGPADNAGSGTSSTGGGGGASGEFNVSGANGGSGIVVVRYQIAQLTATAKATGGAISFYGGKTIHAFTNSGTFATASNWSSATVDYLVVGGGGAGGSGGADQYGGGGGGAGAVRIGTTPIGAHPVSTTIQVGAGGAGIIDDRGNTGTPSYFGTPITAPGGGGGGGKDPNDPGGPGGSGGGSKFDGSADPGGTGSGDDYPGSPPDASPSNGWGNDGGPGNSNGGAGGGGASSTGNNEPGNTGGPGGTGIQIPSTFYNPTQSTIGFPGASGTGWIAGGGGGSTYGNPNSGGGGGGGAAAGVPALGYAGAGWGQKNFSPGDPSQPIDHGNAKANSGSGGGSNNNGRMSFDGGSGIVLIAYPS